MGLEVIVFIAAILFGIFIYWRESKGNRLYRFFNKMVNSKDLQMENTNKKGFVYGQPFLPRLIYVAGTFLLVAVLLQFLTPFKIFNNYYGVSVFFSSIIGTLSGTYIANIIFESGEIIDEKRKSIEEIFQETIEKGKNIIDDLNVKGEKPLHKEEDKTDEVFDKKKDGAKKETKSARDRLKDKGLM